MTARHRKKRRPNTRWIRRLVSYWSMLRVLFQMAAAGAMVSQHEGVALAIGGAAMLLEMVQDRYTGERGGGCPGRRQVG
jgi:hypothetical protein